MVASDPAAIRRAAREQLGFRLTELQARAVGSVLSGRDTLVVSPTGSGKSAVYQLSGALLEGTSVVVSPLLALQEDQLAALTDLEVGAAAIISSLHTADRRVSLGALAAGRLEFVLLSPEQLQHEDVRAALRKGGVDRFVVDEAHCIDAWGADFRPDFLTLGAIRRGLGSPPVLALTATAAPYVRERIIGSLRLERPTVMVGALDRPNIDLAVQRHANRQDVLDAVAEEAAGRSGKGLVYVGRRATAVAVANRLSAAGREAMAYHGSLSRRQRAAVHVRFRAREPVVVVATSAFGLGVDVPDVRFVLHAEPPETIDAYYQEVGRAGRDGHAAEAVLHATIGQPGDRRFAAGASVPDAELCAELAALAEPITIKEVRSRVRRGRGVVLQTVQVLEQHDVLAMDDGGRLHPGPIQWASVADEVLEQLEQRAVVLATRQQMMSRLVDSRACRWATVLGYLGESDVPACGHCDICSSADTIETPGDREQGTLERIEHRSFGAGTVLQRDDDTMVVLFDQAGYRTLSARVLTTEGLLCQP